MSPRKLALFPLQENMGKGTGIGTLTPICPTLTPLSNLRAVAPDWVKIAVPLPYLLSLIMSIASSSVSALTMTSAGPKISSLMLDQNKRPKEVANILVAFHRGISF
jgi:hypothetical protein